MSTDNAAPDVPATQDEEIQAIEHSFMLCHCKLQCAVVTLNEAEDGGFDNDDDEAPAAIRVLEVVVDEMRELRSQLQVWNMARRRKEAGRD